MCRLHNSNLHNHVENFLCKLHKSSQFFYCAKCTKIFQLVENFCAIRRRASEGKRVVILHKNTCKFSTFVILHKLFSTLIPDFVQNDNTLQKSRWQVAQNRRCIFVYFAYWHKKSTVILHKPYAYNLTFVKMTKL